MRKYSKKAQEEVAKMLHEHKHQHKFQSRKQAIAVGLDKARRKGARTPRSPN